MFGAPVAKTNCMWGVSGAYQCAVPDYSVVPPGRQLLVPSGAPPSTSPIGRPAPPAGAQAPADPKPPMPKETWAQFMAAHKL